SDRAVLPDDAVVLQPDDALHVFPEPRLLGELARGHARVPVVAALLVLGDLHAVEPVLDVRPPRDDPRRVPLAAGPGHVLRGGVESVDGAGGVGRGLAIGVAGVVEHLHLGGGVPDVFGPLGAAVEDAAVAARLDPPLQLQLEVAVGLAGDDVAPLPAVGAGERAVF